MGLARAHRVTYVGELGWELYVSTDQAAHVFETLDEAGSGCRAEALRPACARLAAASRRPSAISAMTSPTRTMCWRPGSALPCSPQKGDFIGRDAVLRQAGSGADAPAGAVQADRSGAAALPQRADGARRQDRRHGDLGQLRPPPRRRDRPRLCALRGRERGGRARLAYEIEIAGRRVRAEASLDADVRSEGGAGAGVTRCGHSLPPTTTVVPGSVSARVSASSPRLRRRVTSDTCSHLITKITCAHHPPTASTSSSPRTSRATALRVRSTWTRKSTSGI